MHIHICLYIYINTLIYIYTYIIYIYRSHHILHLHNALIPQGRVVIDRFIAHDLWRVLSPRGCCLLLLLEVNKEDEVKRLVEARGMFCRKLISRRAGGENLLVLDIRKQAHAPL